MALQGTIDSFPLVDVLQLLSTSKKTGRLELVGDRGRGSLWVQDGELTAGTVGGRTCADGPEAIWELLRFSDGSFEFRAEEQPTAPGFDPVPVQDAVAQALGMLGDWEQVEHRVPSLRHRVHLAENLPGGDVRLTAEDWSVVVAAGPAPTVGELISSAALGEFEGCRRLAEMVDRGLLAVEVPATSPSQVVDDGIEVVSGDPDPADTASGGAGHGGAEHGGAPSADQASDEVAPSDAELHAAEVASLMETVPPDSGVAEATPSASAPGVDPFAAPTSPESTPAPPAPEATFPDHFPIDDLVEGGPAAWAPHAEAPGPGAADPHQAFAPPAADPPASGEAGFAPSTPQVSSGAGAFDPPGAEQPGSDPFAVGEPSAFAAPAPAPQPFADPGVEAAAPMATTDPAQSPPSPEDDVLAQIGRLSPKAAEAIAAALGDGEDRGPGH